MSMRLAFVLVMLPAWALGCRTSAPEPSPTASTTPPLTATAPTRAPITRVITEADHRRLVQLAVGDALELPVDRRYLWRAELEDNTFLAESSDLGRSHYLATKRGGTRMVLFGEPACLDAGCGLSRLQWLVNIIVE